VLRQADWCCLVSCNCFHFSFQDAPRGQSVRHRDIQITRETCEPGLMHSFAFSCEYKIMESPTLPIFDQEMCSAGEQISTHQHQLSSHVQCHQSRRAFQQQSTKESVRSILHANDPTWLHLQRACQLVESAQPCEITAPVFDERPTVHTFIV
jgi:hypothetical protein